MSNKESKYSTFFFILLFITSCDFSKNKENLNSNEYANKNFTNYKSLHKEITDSIFTYTDSLLATFLTEYYSEWQVDSLICINSTKDKLFTTINISQGSKKDSWSDDIKELLGKKINGKWYFFIGGGSLTVPRDMYDKDEMHPLTFYELSQIARKNMMESALVKKDGEYVVSDEWIDKKFYSTGYGLFKTRAEYDSIHWMLILRKWTEKIDTNEYKPLKKKEAAPIN